MKELNFFSFYDQNMDGEIMPLCSAMNSLVGIHTTESCCGHEQEPISIFFQVTNPVGLFFLVRCVDRRYWKHGHEWNITLSVGDSFDNKILPTNYILQSQTKGESAYEEAQSLIDNLNHHLNHENFLKAFDISLEGFHYREIEKEKAS